MTKRKSAPPPPQAKPVGRGTRNPQLNAQTRKVLRKHYAAKHGVR
ncbi:MAG TPA: hypothetical protein VMH32_23220 [Burkholderiales bacterium]|nr:hypothetical protein [Burkholderiales bacterium]